MKPRFGLVGCGSIARFHVQGLQKAGASIVHVADLDERAARSYGQRLGCRYSLGYRELIEDPEVSVISVLAGSRAHREICLAALAAGKDVVCEKTMTDSAREAEEVARAARSSGRLFFTAYMKRFFPAARKAQELLPRLGRIFSAQVRTYQRWGNFYEAADLGAFSSVVSRYGGAVIKCAGSHMIDLTLWLLGRPSSLYAHIDYVPGTDFDRKATAVLEYPDGMAAGFEAATHPLTRIGYERNSWDEWLEIQGTGGRLRLTTTLWDSPDRNPALLEHYDEASASATEYRFEAVNPFEVEMRHFVHCLERREQGRPDVIDGLAVDAVIEAMGLSALEKRSVALDYRGF